MRRLTVVLSRWSTATIVDGGRRSFADSGEHLRRTTAKFAQLRPQLLDSFDTNGPGSIAELEDYSMVTGVASFDNMELNSGELSPDWWRR
jgi:hypothetical protein